MGAGSERFRYKVYLLRTLPLPSKSCIHWHDGKQPAFERAEASSSWEREHLRNVEQTWSVTAVGL